MSTVTAERVWSKVNRRGDEECWPWVGATTTRGYGYLAVGGRRNRRALRAHRLAYELAVGPIPEGGVVMHLCDNPPCCNPRHLQAAASNAENIRDAFRKGKISRPRRLGDTHPRASLTRVRAQAIRDRHAAGGVTHAALADEFGISRSLVSLVIEGKRYHLNEVR